MASGKPPDYIRGLELAHRLCGEAIDILDASEAPPTIAPHLEAAIHEINQALGQGAANPPGFPPA